MHKFQRVLFKISGESLATNNNFFNHDKLAKFAIQIAKIQKHFPNLEIVIVIGGGNIWRGKNATQGNNLKFTNHDSDYIGMLATIINGIALKNYLINQKIATVLYSSFNLTKIAQDYKIDNAVEALKAKKVIICAGGTGSPFFTTDTTASLRACELNCDAIFFAKNKVDGVYDSDPVLNPKAKRFDTITFQECLNLKLEIMDQTAFTLCKANNVQVLVFNANEKDNFFNLLNDKIKYTLIK